MHKVDGSPLHLKHYTYPVTNQVYLWILEYSLFEMTLSPIYNAHVPHDDHCCLPIKSHTPVIHRVMIGTYGDEIIM